MVSLESLKKQFPLKKDFLGRPVQYVNALYDVSIEFFENRITGIVGESGSGKSSLARVLCGVYSPDAGSFAWNGFNSQSMDKREWKNYRKNIQMVFQDPYSSLNPRMKIYDILNEPFLIHHEDYPDLESNRRKISEVLSNVGLSEDTLTKYPHEFSGGQRQRIAIARALMLEPKILIFDEAVSALDVSIQAQILNLVLDIQQEFKMTCIFITHDLSVVSYLAHNIAVMYGGNICEYNKTEEIFSSPKHPYTRLLLSSIPDFKNSKKKTFEVKEAEPVSTMYTEGCSFFHRCPQRIDICRSKNPQRSYYENAENGRFFYQCFNPLSGGPASEKK